MCSTHEPLRLSDTLRTCMSRNNLVLLLLQWNTCCLMCSTHVLDMHVRRVSENVHVVSCVEHLSLIWSCVQHIYVGCQKLSCVHVNTCCLMCCTHILDMHVRRVSENVHLVSCVPHNDTMQNKRDFLTPYVHVVHTRTHETF